MFFRFLTRNVSFAISSARNLPEVKRAMREFDRDNPFCAYCGEVGDTDIHHKIPVSVAPDLAADKNNMIPLCRGNKCHFVVGHFSNWRDYNSRVDATCNAASGGKVDG